MYLPAIFREEHPEIVQAAMHDHSSATLVTYGTDGLEANLVPFILLNDRYGRDVLRDRLAIANPQIADLRGTFQAMTSATMLSGTRGLVMRHDPASTAIVVMLRGLKMYGIAGAVSDLIEQGAPAFEAAVPTLSQRPMAEMAEREVSSIAEIL